MTVEEVETFIAVLEEESKEMCVYPEGRNFDCCDCSLCRYVFFNRVREELKNTK